MSIEKAIERIEEIKNQANYATLDTISAFRYCLKILKEEALSPCERCKYWVGGECEKRYYLHEPEGTGKKSHSVSIHIEAPSCPYDFWLKDLFEPKEAE